MKKLYIITALLLTTTLAIKAQHMGDILVTENISATLSFAPHQVKFAVAANNLPLEEGGFMFYDIIQDGSEVIIRGNNPEAPRMLITVKLENGDIWVGTLAYSEGGKGLYIFKKDEPKVSAPEKEVKKEEVKETKVEGVMTAPSGGASKEERLEQLLREQPYYITLGDVTGGVEVQLSNMKNDNNNTYLKFIIRNNSANEYIIDGMLFKYLEGKRRGLNRKEAQIEERIMPLLIEGPEMVKAYSETQIGVVIPLFSVTKTGKMVVHIRERKGTRNLNVTVSGRDMLSIKVF